MDSDICRTCLKKTATISIFEINDDIKLCTKITRCASVNIEAEDGLPERICETCESELSICYNFISKCETSDRSLRELLFSQQLLEQTTDDKVEVKYEEADILDDPDFYLDLKEEYMVLVKESEEVEPKDKYKKVKRKVNKNSTTCEKLGPIQCMVCGRMATSSSALDTHMRTHTGEKPFSCNKCAATFSRKGSLKKHVQRHSLVREPKVKRNKNSRVYREKLGPMQCVVCGLMVNSPSAMEIHSRTHTGEKPYACAKCDKRFGAKGTLKRHYETRHSNQRERRFTCETCGSSFFRKNEIIIHMRTHTGERPYACPFCPNSFQQISSLIRHKRTHTGDKPFPCPACGKQFADKSMIAKHMTVHSSDRNFKCHLCPKSVKSKTSLKIHLRLHSNEKHNVCNYCGMAFAMKGNLKMHMMRKHSEKSGQCNVCLKTFSDLETHMRKHTGEKPFICAVCDRSFGTKVSLATHMTFKHDNVGKYKCSVGDCTKSFPIPSMLEFHLLKQHTNQTPHICQHCSRGFFRVSDLSRHLRVSHMDPPVKLKPHIKVEGELPNNYHS